MSKIIFLFVLIRLSTSQPAYTSLAAIEDDLRNMNINLMTAQQNLRDNLLNYSQTIDSCSSNLKSMNMTPTLSSSLDQMVVLLNQFRTVDEFEPYANISSCGDVNYKITMMDFDFNKYIDVRITALKNQSVLTVQYSQVYSQYSSNIRNLGGMLSSTERMVWNVFNKFKDSVKVYTDFVVLLGVSASRLSYYNALLTIFKKDYCQCLDQITFENVNSTLDYNVKVVEKKLIAFQSKVLSSTALTLRTVSNAVNATDSTLNSNFKSLEGVLTDILTTSDYPTFEAPNVTSCDEFWEQFYFVLSKHRQYWNILISVSQNYSKIVYNRVQINYTLVNNPSPLKIVKDAMNQTMKLEDVYEGYKSQLVYSIWKMARSIYMLITDSYCTCDIEGFTTVSSTSTTMTSRLPKNRAPPTKAKTTTKSTRKVTTSTRRPTTTKKKITSTSLARTTTKELTTAFRPTSSETSSISTMPSTNLTTSSSTSTSPTSTSTSSTSTSPRTMRISSTSTNPSTTTTSSTSTSTSSTSTSPSTTSTSSTSTSPSTTSTSSTSTSPSTTTTSSTSTSPSTSTSSTSTSTSTSSTSTTPSTSTTSTTTTLPTSTTSSSSTSTSSTSSTTPEPTTTSSTSTTSSSSTSTSSSTTSTSTSTTTVPATTSTTTISQTSSTTCTPGSTTAAPCDVNKTIVASGTCMQNGQRIDSCNGCYQVVMQGDNNFCTYVTPTGACYFASQTYSQVLTGMIACMQSDGNFVVQWQSAVMWQTFTSGNPGAYAILRDDGYFAVQLGSTILWKSPTAVCPFYTSTTTSTTIDPKLTTSTTQKVCDPKNSTIADNTCLNAGQSIFSCNGCYNARMQSDGNFVIYNRANTAYFATNTQNSPATMACMKGGSFILTNSRGRNFYQIKTGVAGAYAFLRDDGYFLIMSGTTELAKTTSTVTCG